MERKASEHQRSTGDNTKTSDPRPPLRFWFKIQSMIHRSDVRQRWEDGSWRPDRYDFGEWLPPRPHYYNLQDPRHPHGTWYFFDETQVNHAAPPEPGLVTHYKTFSFYVNKERIWIYPCNALTYSAGNGRQEPPPLPDTITEEGAYNESDNDNGGDDDGLEDPYDPSAEDWLELSFASITNGQNVIASHATVRGISDSLHSQRADQTWPSEVLPERYCLSDDAHTNDMSKGGLTAEIPIKIALIALSVPPARVHNALLNSLRNTYASFNQTRGQGWTDRRGLVVRVYCAPDAVESLRMFERNGLGFGHFFP